MSIPVASNTMNKAGGTVYVAADSARHYRVVISVNATASDTLTATQEREGTQQGISAQPQRREDVIGALRRAGLLDYVPEPAPRPDTPEEAEQRERLARLLGQGTPLSQIVIEGRGPS
jgi:hypothetical protein